MVKNTRRMGKRPMPSFKKTAKGEYIVPVMYVNRMVGRVGQRIITNVNGIPIPYTQLINGGKYE